MIASSFGTKYPYLRLDAQTSGNQSGVASNKIVDPSLAVVSLPPIVAPTSTGISDGDPVEAILTYGNPAAKPFDARFALNAGIPTSDAAQTNAITSSAEPGLTNALSTANNAASTTTSRSQQPSVKTDFITSRNLKTADTAISSAIARLNRMSELVVQMGAIAARPVPTNDFGNSDRTFQTLLNQISALALSPGKNIVNLLSGSQGLYVSLGAVSRRSRSLTIPRMDIIQTLQNQLLSNISLETTGKSQVALAQLNTAALVIGNFQNILRNSAASVQRELAAVNVRLEAALKVVNG